ncbi:MAG: hypothetical protein IJS26_04535 [Alphaproteobacteria bacterium]|nr:hypothetical protein [Alphaproteobacteria bacterium]
MENLKCFAVPLANEGQKSDYCNNIEAHTVKRVDVDTCNIVQSKLIGVSTGLKISEKLFTEYSLTFYANNLQSIKRELSNIYNDIGTRQGQIAINPLFCEKDTTVSGLNIKLGEGVNPYDIAEMFVRNIIENFTECEKLFAEYDLNLYEDRLKIIKQELSYIYNDIVKRQRIDDAEPLDVILADEEYQTKISVNTEPYLWENGRDEQ